MGSGDLINSRGSHVNNVLISNRAVALRPAAFLRQAGYPLTREQDDAGNGDADAGDSRRE